MLEARKRVWWCAVGLATLGLVLPTPVIADSPAAGTKPAKMHDIRLNDHGDLHVVVVDAQGQRMPENRVQLNRTGLPETTTGVTDAKGQYTFHGLTGGVYQLQTDQGVCMCRVWTTSAAPPSSAKSLLIVNDSRITRGQRPIREIFRSDPILMTAIVAAAIAIPIAIHQSRDKSSGS